MIRIGHGYDSHTFEEAGDHIILGGIRIPFEKGVKAHSDGDVLIHAIGDALLGAAALGDIGRHFSDQDVINKNISGSRLLKKILQLIKEQSYIISNIDATVIIEKPKLAPFISPIRESLAEIVDLPMSHISVKATTNEKMGWIGRGEGLAVHAVVLLDQLVDKSTA